MADNSSQAQHGDNGPDLLHYQSDAKRGATPTDNLEQSEAEDYPSPLPPAEMIAQNLDGPTRPRAFSTVPSFPSGHIDLDGQRSSIQVDPLPQSLSITLKSTVDEGSTLKSGVDSKIDSAADAGTGSGSGHAHAHPTPRVPGPQPKSTHQFITSPANLLQEVNRDPAYIFNAIKNMTNERAFLRTCNRQLQSDLDSAQHDCREILKDYNSCFENFNKLSTIKDQKLAIVFTMMDRLGHTRLPGPMGYFGQNQPAAIYHGPPTPSGDMPGIVIGGPTPPVMGPSANRLRSWREKYPVGWSPSKLGAFEDSIPEEGSSWEENSTVQTASKSSDDGLNNTKLDPNAFIPTANSVASDESLTPTPSMRTFGGNSIMLAEPPTPTPTTQSIPKLIPGTYKAYEYAPFGTPLPNPYPPQTAADLAFKESVASLPPRFYNVCPYFLSSDLVACPLGQGCRLQRVCHSYNDVNNPGCPGAQRGDCVMIHEFRSCEKEVRGEECVFKGVAPRHGRGRKGRFSGDVREEMGAMGTGTLAERARKHYNCRAHRRSVDTEEWVARVTVAGLREAHRDGRY